MTFDPWIVIGRFGQTLKFLGLTWHTLMPSFNPVICIGQELCSNLNLTFEWPLTPEPPLPALMSTNKILEMIWHTPISIFSPVICIGHVLCPYLWLTFEWPLIFEPLPTELWSKLKFSQNDLTHPRAKFQLPTSFSYGYVRLVLFIEKWVWPNNYWPRPLKNDMVLYCTSVPTYPPNLKQIRPTVAGKNLAEVLCKEKEGRIDLWMTFDPLTTFAGIYVY